MKILMATMSLGIGGAETHIVELCRTLSSLGHSITVAGAEGEYTEALTESGCRFVPLPLNTKKPSAVIRSYRGLYSLIRDGGFDIVHSHARIPSFILKMIRRRLDFRFVTTAHLDFRVNFLWRRLSCWGDATLAVSRDLVSYLADNYGVDTDRVKVTVNGIDTERFSPVGTDESLVCELSLRPCLRILYISRLDTDRSAPAFVLADIAPELAEKYGDIEILAVGDGDARERLEARIAEVNAKMGRETVRTVGARTDIYRFAAVSDIAVAVSRSALEMMSSGLPVILSGNQGHLGIITDENLPMAMDTNFCCRGAAAVSRERMLADISALLDMSERERAELGRRNRDTVLRHYSARRMAEDCLEVYRSMANIPFRYGDTVISGYYGFGNLGDDAVLDLVTRRVLDADPYARLTALCREPEKMKEKLDPRVKTVSRTDPFAIYSALKHCRLLISGGGALFQDTTSRKSLLYYTAIVNAAKRLGKRVYIYANGAGPLCKPSSRLRVKRTLSGVSRISVRDRASFALLTDIGVAPEDITVSADPAFLALKRERGEPPSGLLSDSRRYCVISMRECVGEMAERLDSGRLEEELAELIRRLGEEYGLCPIFTSMQEKHDGAILRRIMDRARVEGGVYFSPEGADGLLAVLSDPRVKLAISMRLHTLLFSAVAALPMLAVSYDVKVDALAESIGLRYITDAREVDCDRIFAEVGEILCDGDRLRAELSATAEKMYSAAEDDILQYLGLKV